MDYPGCGTGQSYGTLCVEGSLDAGARAPAPITFTSINDNSVGGDTGSGTPAAGDSGGINGSGAGASIDLENDVVDYAEFGVLVNGDNDQSASVTLEANSFSDELSEAVDIDVGSTPPVLEKNVAVDARTPGDNIVGYYFVEGSALNFNYFLTGNSASGTGRC